VRLLKACVYCTQRHVPEAVFDLNGLGLISNRCLDLDGSETNGVGPIRRRIPWRRICSRRKTPIAGRQWTLEPPLSNNAFLRSVDPTDAEQYGLSRSKMSFQRSSMRHALEVPF
jgi:hypothetical protein